MERRSKPTPLLWTALALALSGCLAGCERSESGGFGPSLSAPGKARFGAPGGCPNGGSCPPPPGGSYRFAAPSRGPEPSAEAAAPSDENGGSEPEWIAELSGPRPEAPESVRGVRAIERPPETPAAAAPEPPAPAPAAVARFVPILYSNPQICSPCRQLEGLLDANPGLRGLFRTVQDYPPNGGGIPTLQLAQDSRDDKDFPSGPQPIYAALLRLSRTPR